jgi:hypothetical protein
MAGNIIKYDIYVSKKKNTIADFSNFDNIPTIFNSPNLCKDIINAIEKGGDSIMNKYVDYKYTDGHKREMNIKLAILPHTKSLFTQLETSDKSFYEIFEAVRKDTGSKSPDQELWNEFMLNLNPLHSIGLILLRHKSIKPF